MADPDVQKRGDYNVGGGGGGGGLKKIFFAALRASVWSENKGRDRAPGPLPRSPTVTALRKLKTSEVPQVFLTRVVGYSDYSVHIYGD